MAVDSLNVSELAQIAREGGADVFEGALRYPSDPGGWLIGDLDFCEYLDRYRNQQIMVIIAPLGQAPAPIYTCGICGFVYNERGECPRCGAAREKAVSEALVGGSGDVLVQVRKQLSVHGEGLAQKAEKGAEKERLA